MSIVQVPANIVALIGARLAGGVTYGDIVPVLAANSITGNSPLFLRLRGQIRIPIFISKEIDTIGAHLTAKALSLGVVMVKSSSDYSHTEKPSSKYFIIISYFMNSPVH